MGYVAHMSVVGTEPKVYSIPSKLRIACNNTKCTKTCPLAMGVGNPELTEIKIEPRQLLAFTDSPDFSEDALLKRNAKFGCKSVTAEPIEVNQRTESAIPRVSVLH